MKWEVIISPHTNMLIGEYIHTVDEKNRLSLPIKFRKELGKKLVLTRGLDRCIFVFTIEQWKDIAGRLGEHSLLSADNRSFNRFMFGSATEVDVDASGRILLPDFLKTYAGIIGEKVALVGMQTRAEIWHDATWQTYKATVDGQADQLAEKLSHVGIL